MKIHPKSVLVTALFGAISSVASAQSGPEAAPFRPGVAAGSATSAAGYFELEMNFDTLKGGGARVDALGGLLKYGLADSATLLIGVPYTRVSGGGESERGLGDSLLGIKWVQKINKESAAGFQLSTSLPTGSKAFRSDDPQLALTGIYGVDFSGLHLDLNAGIRYNTGNVPYSKSTYIWVAALGGPIANGLGWYGEVSGTRTSGLGNGTTALGALTYTVNPKLVLDASVSRGRTAGLNATGFGVGMTYLFAK